MKYLILCALGMCGELKFEELKINRNIRKDENDTALVCPHCGGCQFYIVYKDMEPYKKYLEEIK